MSELRHIMIQAEQAMTEGRWEDAQRFYQEALVIQPNHPRANHGLHNAQKAVDKEREIEARIAEANERFEEGNYQGAVNLYIGLMEYAAAEPRIPRFHTYLEQQRNRAKDLQSWSERVRRVLQQAQRLGDEGDWQAAGQRVEDLQKQLPPEPLYEPLMRSVEGFRLQALRQADDLSLYEQAMKLLRAKEYEKGIERLKLIQPSSSVYEKAQRALKQVEPFLKDREREFAPVEDALEKGARPPDILSLLDKLRTDYGDTSRWQRLLVQVGMSYGRDLLEAGRERNQQRNFKRAQQCFADAQEAFQKVLKVFPSHLEAQPLYDEAVDLAAVAGFEAQAQEAERQGGRAGREEALEAYKLAHQRLARARSEGRDYAAVGIMVDTLQSKVEAELERIREEERRLRDAARLEREHHLAEARQQFRETLDALLLEHRQQATEGLSRVEKQIREFETWMDQGREAATPAETVRAYKEARELWDAGPGLATALESALLAACEAALHAEREEAMVTYAQQGQALYPDNRRWQSYLDVAGLKPRLQATLEQITQEFRALSRGDEIRAEALDPLLKKLDGAEVQLAQAGDPEALDDVAQRIVTLRETLRERRQDWATYESHYRKAHTRREAGEWRAALRALDAALSALQEEVPAAIEGERERWDAVVTALEHAREVVSEALPAARETYATAAQDVERPDLQAALTATLNQLRPAHEALAEATEQVTAVAGALPGDLRDLGQEVEELQTRAHIGVEALRKPSASEGLLQIQALSSQRGSDATLEALRAHLQGEAAKVIEETKQAAQDDIRAGDFTAALEKLRQVRQLDPADEETAALYARLQQRRHLEGRLRQIQLDVQSKLDGNSRVDALQALRQGLHMLLEPEVDLPARVREILNDLIALGDREEGLALGRPEYWEQAQVLTVELGRLRTENWAAGRAVALVDQWRRLARDVALLGVVSSAAQLGDLLQSFRAAASYLQAHPQDTFAVEQAAQRQEALITQLNTSASKRVDRARKALEEGDFEIALQNLQDVEEEFYAPVELEFPGLLDGYEDVQDVRDDLVALQRRAEQLQELTEHAQPRLETARQAYLNGDWDTAEQTLEELPPLQKAPHLQTQVATLREQIAQDRVKTAREKLHEILTQVETGLQLAKRPEDLTPHMQSLIDLKESIDLQALDVEERQRHSQLLDKVRELQEDLKAGAMWEAQVEAHLAEGRYEKALKALEEALKVTREASQRVALEEKRQDLEKLANKQRERDLLLKQGQALFNEQRYVEARQQLAKAGQLGADVGGYLDAARAGALLMSARRLWKEEQDAESALLDLEDLVPLTEDNPAAAEIGRAARRLRRKIERAQRDAQAVQSALTEARRLLLVDEFEAAEAKVQEALEKAPASPEAQVLQGQIPQYKKIHEVLTQAQTAYSEGRYTEAQQQVKTVLELAPKLTPVPDLTQAHLLQTQIHDGLEAEKAIAEVKILAQNQQFKEARARLMALARQGEAPEEVQETQKWVEALEREQWRRVVQPIEDHYRDGEYAEALHLCRQALGQTGDPQLVQELQNRRSLIINRWAQTQVTTLQAQLRGDPNEEQLRTIEAQIQQLLDLTPLPEASDQRQLKELLKATRTRRLRTRLTQARARYDDWVEGGQGSPEVALKLTKRVQDDAEALGTQVELDITLDAAALETEIQEALRDKQERERRDRRDQILEQAREARQRLEDPAYIEAEHPSDLDLKLDLKQVEEWAQEILSIEGCTQDGDAQELRNWAQQALEAFDRTRQALAEARSHLGGRQFSDADYALRGIGRVSPLLKPAYEAQRTLVRNLRQAEENQEEGAWALALEGYRRALDLDADLQLLLEKDLERCYQRLLGSVEEEVTEALSQIPPQTARARRALKEAQERHWIHPNLERDYIGLQNWLASQEEVARAAALLQGEGDPQMAQEALREARQRLPGDRSADAIRQWETLAKALLAWQERELETARRAVEKLAPPVSELERVSRLRAKLERAAADTALIERAKHQIRAALMARPARYAEAVQILCQELAQIKDDPRVKQLQEKIYRPLRAELESQRQAGHYAEAIAMGDLLLRLGAHPDEVRQLVETLPQERQEQLEVAIDDSRQALEDYAVEVGEQALHRARLIAAPEGDIRLEQLAQDLEALRILLEQVRQGLSEVRDLMERAQWADAVERFLAVRGKAPGYQPVLETERTLQKQLLTRAETHRQVSEFAAGLRLCDLALRVEPQATAAHQLRDRIFKAQQSALVEVKRQVQEGLSSWRLASVPALLGQWQEIAPDDADLKKVEERYQNMQEVLPALRTTTQTGWKALHEGDYKRALTKFAPDLRGLQPPAEVHRWHEYVQLLYAAIRLVEDEEAFEQSAGTLGEAVSLIRVDGQTHLPDVFYKEDGEKHLKEQRRYALYHAHRLRQAARKMAHWYQQSDDYYLQGGTEALARSVALVDKVQKERRAFLRLAADPSTPPDSFPLGGWEDEPLDEPLPKEESSVVDSERISPDIDDEREKLESVGREPPVKVDVDDHVETAETMVDPQRATGGLLGLGKRLLANLGRQREPAGDNEEQTPLVEPGETEKPVRVEESLPTSPPVARPPVRTEPTETVPLREEPYSQESSEPEQEADEPAISGDGVSGGRIPVQKPTTKPPLRRSEDESVVPREPSSTQPDLADSTTGGEPEAEFPEDDTWPDLDEESDWSSGYWSDSDFYASEDEE